MRMTMSWRSCRMALLVGTWCRRMWCRRNGNCRKGVPGFVPYEAFATGAGKDENGHYMALVLVHAADASAEENVGLLRRIIEEEGSMLYDISWSDYIDVEKSEIHADGRVLRAKLRGGFANNWLDWVIQRDGLILYE